MKLSNKFIKATNEFSSFEKFIPAPYFRRSFQLDFKPEHAEITICGLGFYELYINGENITKGPLAPYISNPDDICYYDSYRITELLRKGENTIGIILGNGFRNCYGGFIWDFEKAASRGALTLALALEAKDGKSSFELEADEAFKVHSSPILYDDLRMGYCYDSRLEIPGWSLPDFDDSAWDNAIPEKAPRGIARLCTAEPIAVRKELKAVNIKHYDSLAFAHDKTVESVPDIESTVRSNVYVYDFGVNTAGVTQLKINGKPGQKIVIRHAEHTVRDAFSINTTVFQLKSNLDNDKKYQDYGQTDTFICKGGEEIFTPRFKYDGFRYALVEGLEPQQATEDALIYLVMSSDVKVRCEFECSNSTINALQQCARNSDLANLYYFPTDCPHREKNGWTADAWLSSEHMLLNLTAENSLREWMFNIQCVQRKDGALPGIIPTGGWGFEWGNGPVWDSVCVEIPYALYRATGNTDIIKENAAMIMRYIFYVSSHRDENGLTGFGLGDWCDPFFDEKGYIASPLEVTASMASLNLAQRSAFLFKSAGLKKEADYAAAFAAEMRESIRSSLIDFTDMTVKGDCQTSQALGLAFGVFNSDELPAAQKRLVDIIHRDGDINTCGVYGIRYIYHILSDIGEAELAFKIITSTSRTCYGHWIENGATALCESFKDFNSPQVDSRNHHFFGDISGWFIQHLAGLKPNPHCDNINYYEIAPNFISELSFARADYVSPAGNIAVKWEKSADSKIILYAQIPSGIEAKAILPNGYTFKDGQTSIVLPSGTNELEIVQANA